MGGLIWMDLFLPMDYKESLETVSLQMSAL